MSEKGISVSRDIDMFDSARKDEFYQRLKRKLSCVGGSKKAKPQRDKRNVVLCRLS